MKLKDFIAGSQTRELESLERMIMKYPAWIRDELTKEIENDPIKYAIWLNARICRGLMKSGKSE
jgi:hypothetical protein